MLFNDAMRHANVWDGAHPPPVSQCHLPPGKGFAFITFLRAEDATAALVFNGISFSYRNLRVGRPQNYQGPADTPKQAGVGGGTGGGGGGVAGVSAHVPDSPNKLFLGGLPNTMSETDVLGMLTPFGTLKAFHLVMDPGTGMFKGFGFCEFEDPALSDTVCQALNGQKLGDKILIVQRASLGSTAIPDIKPEDNDISSVVRFVLNLSVPVPEVVNLLRSIEGPAAESRVLALLNLSSIEKLRDDDFYHDLFVDVHEACSPYGQILSILIPRISVSAGSKFRPAPGSIGRAFVEFDSVESARGAMKHLGGSIYDQDRHLIAMYYPEQKYAEGRTDC